LNRRTAKRCTSIWSNTIEGESRYQEPSTELHVRRPLNRAPTHPGEFFREILEEHLRLSISEAVSRMGISRQSLHAVLRGEAAVTADLVATVRALPFRSDRPFGVRAVKRSPPRCLDAT
jgi:hypothetical protein